MEPTEREVPPVDVTAAARVLTPGVGFAAPTRADSVRVWRYETATIPDAIKAP